MARTDNRQSTTKVIRNKNLYQLRDVKEMSESGESYTRENWSERVWGKATENVRKLE